MDNWYNKFKSNEIVLSDRKPDVSSIPEDAPAGAFSRIQKRKWKLWLVVNDLYNPTSVKNIFVRSGYKNDWIEYTPTFVPINDDWKLLGNSGTNPSTNFLGTTDNQRLVFRTNNTEKATILGNGSVGVGISTPTRLLEVQNTGGTFSQVALFKSLNGGGGYAVRGETVNGGAATGVYGELGVWDGTRWSGVRGNSGTSNAPAVIGFQTVSGGLSAYFNERVGIGTATPTSTFHVNGSYATNPTVINSTYTVLGTDNTLICNNATTNITITLPNPTTCIGREITISRYAGSTGSIRVQDARGATSSIQGLNGALGVTTTITGLGNNENWNVRFKAVTVGAVTSWLRIG